MVSNAYVSVRCAKEYLLQFEDRTQRMNRRMTIFCVDVYTNLLLQLQQ